MHCHVKADARVGWRNTGSVSTQPQKYRHACTFLHFFFGGDHRRIMPRHDLVFNFVYANVGLHIIHWPDLTLQTLRMHYRMEHTCYKQREGTLQHKQGVFIQQLPIGPRKYTLNLVNLFMSTILFSYFTFFWLGQVPQSTNSSHLTH